MSTRTRTTTIPTMTFGGKRTKVTVKIGRGGRLVLTGTGTFSPDDFRRFLAHATWLVDQVTAPQLIHDQLELFSPPRT